MPENNDALIQNHLGRHSSYGVLKREIQRWAQSIITQLSSHREMKAVVTMLSLLALSLLTGCLNFGDDIELKGAEIDGSVLKTIEAQTGLQLPEGIGGQYYFYLGSGVDDALWFKASVSEAQKTELLKDTLFTHEDEQPCQQMQMNFDRDWWKVDRLQAPAHYSAKINGGTGLVACSIGDESGKITLYLVWFST